MRFSHRHYSCAVQYLRDMPRLLRQPAHGMSLCCIICPGRAFQICRAQSMTGSSSTKPIRSHLIFPFPISAQSATHPGIFCCHIYPFFDLFHVMCRLGAPAGTNKAPVSLWIYTTPTGANSTRLIINFARNEAFPKPPATQKGLAKLRADLFLFVRNRLLGFIFKSRWGGYSFVISLGPKEHMGRHAMGMHEDVLQLSWLLGVVQAGTDKMIDVVREANSSWSAWGHAMAMPCSICAELALPVDQIWDLSEWFQAMAQLWRLPYSCRAGICLAFIQHPHLGLISLCHFTDDVSYQHHQLPASDGFPDLSSFQSVSSQVNTSRASSACQLLGVSSKFEQP